MHRVGEQHEVLFYKPTDWSVIGRFDGFEENEVPLSITMVTFNNISYLAIGTYYPGTEDMACHGN